MSSCLCIVLDCNAFHWGKLAEKTDSLDVIDTLIRATTSYATAHLSLSATNRVVLLGATAAISNPLLFASDLSEEVDPTKAIDESIRQALTVSARSSKPYVSVPVAPALTLALCHINRHRKLNSDVEGRILIISLAEDLVWEHNVLMNIFFTAHKHNVVVDVANLVVATPVLQQAADITAGVHLNIENPKHLLGQLMCQTLGGAASRNLFVRQAAPSVDYRASCACHGKLVAVGWICSVCLAVHCQFTPICCVCNSVFKITGILRKTKKRRKETS